MVEIEERKGGKERKGRKEKVSGHFFFPTASGCVPITQHDESP
jgi:hypothetical protein